MATKKKPKKNAVVRRRLKPTHWPFGTGGLDDLLLTQDFGGTSPGSPKRTGVTPAGTFELHASVRLKGGFSDAMVLAGLLAMPDSPVKIPVVAQYVLDNGVYATAGKPTSQFSKLMMALFLALPRSSNAADDLEPHCAPRLRIITEFFDTKCTPRFLFEVRLKVCFNSADFAIVQAAFLKVSSQSGAGFKDAIAALICAAKPDNTYVDTGKFNNLMYCAY
jgi:hypothetical protein